MKDSLKWLLSKFPSFLDKSNGSNFYKSSSVINEAFKEFRQNLFNTHLSHRLDKRVLLWKEQSVENDYTINFFVNLPYLKMVNCYKNDTLIYTESYEYEDEVNTFIYSHDDSSENVIPSDKFYITVETWEEYVLAKGFPENDEPLGDIYDHDESLDHIGALYDIPRKRYTYKESTNYANTEPQYNNRLTEDDYHYMNRILGYISHMQDTPLPVLEVWKLFGIDLSKISLINRERYLCKMYSVTKHGGDNWEPYPWEHKDPMGCFWPEPVFFFVEVDNHSPVYGQSINFSFTFMNMFGEDKGKDYLIDVYLDDEKIASEVDPLSVYEFSTKDVDDSEPLVFKFIANPLDTRMDTLESDDIIITIKGCNSADWYVSVNGDDNNIGDKDHPFRTVKKAVDSVEGSRNVIVLVEGTFWITNELLVDTPMSIISCRGATIRNDTNYDFFRILQECSLYLQGITLKHKCCYMYGFDDYFLNNNRTQNPVYLRINPDFMCKPKVNIGVGSLTEKIHAHRNLTVSGVLTNANNGDAISGEDIQLYEGTTLLETETTGSNGEYTINHRVDVIGQHGYKLNHEESEKYCMGDTEFSILVEAMPTILTATFDNEVLLDDELIIGYDLVDYYGDSVTVGTVKLVEDGQVVASVSPGTDIHYTPTTVGTHSYQLTWSHDETYVASESETSNVIVRRYVTSLVLETDKSKYLPTENVQVTGTLTDELGNTVSNQSVKLYDGETLVYTGVTNSNGVVTYTGKFSLGKHTLQWKYNQSRKYEAVNSNSYRIRVKESVVENINLFLYPNKKIGVTGTSVGLNVLALDQNGEPISTGFKLMDTYTGKCGEYPATSYTTGNDGWWTGTVSTQAIVECHGTYFQAISTVDNDIYSNVVHVFDWANPILDVTGEIYSSISTFDKDTTSVPVSVILTDEEDDPLPNETFDVRIMTGDAILTTTTGTTNVQGEAELNINVPSSVKGNALVLRLVYNGRANAYDKADDMISLPYMFTPSIVLSTDKAQYLPTETVTATAVIKDEFNTVLAGKSIRLLDGTVVKDTVSSDSAGKSEFSVTGLSTGEHSLSAKYTGTGYYYDATSNNVTVTIGKYASSISLATDKTSLTVDGTFTLSGKLTTGEVTGLPVKIYQGNTLIDTVQCDSNGNYSKTITASTVGEFTYKAVFDGDASHDGSQSSNVTVTVNKYTSSININTSKSTVEIGEAFTLSGKLTTGSVTGASVKIYKGSTLLDTVTCDSNGDYTYSNIESTTGDYTYKAVYDGDNKHVGAESSSVSVHVADYSLGLVCDKRIISSGEVATFTATVKDNNVAVSGATVQFNVGGTTYNRTTDSNGVATVSYTGTGSTGEFIVSASVFSLVESVTVYDGTSGYVTAVVTGNSITLGSGSSYNWLVSSGSVVVDWGDGSTDTVNNPDNPLIHTYSDGLNEHLIIFDGTVTSIGSYCFTGCTGLTSVTIPSSVTSLGESCFYGCSGLTSVTIPDSVTSLGEWCFYNCTGLTSIVIPDSVTSLGELCFYYCSGLIDYELYWETQPIQYTSTKMPVNTGTVFTIPTGTRQLYIDAGYPVERLVEREPTTDVDTVLSLLSDKQSIATDESLNLTGILSDENGNPVKQASIKLFDGNTLIDTVTTDNLGAYTKTLNNLTKGSHTFHASFEGDSMYNASVSGDVSVTVSEHSYALVLSCSSPVIQKGGSASVVACLTRDGSVYTGQSLSYIVKHGSTIIDSGTLVTGSDGKATISYTGTGVGDVVFEVSYGSLLQETYELFDCILYDDMLSNTVSNYDFSTNQGNSLVSESDGFLFTGGASARYFQHKYQNVSSLIGKTVRFEVTGVPSNQWRLGIFPYANGSYTNIIGDYVKDSGTIHLDHTFDDDTIEHCLFRIYVNGTGYTLKTTDFKVYSI